jgi:hypothetical protein
MKAKERSVTVMAEINDMKVPISEITKNIQCTITLTGTTAFKIRNSIGWWLFRLGARIMAVGVNFEIDGNPSNPPDNSILLGEIRKLHAELKEGIWLTAKMTKQVQRALTRWDCDGVPETRK